MIRYRITFNDGTSATVRASCSEERAGLILFRTDDSEVGQFVYSASVKDIKEQRPDPLGSVDDDLFI